MKRLAELGSDLTGLARVCGPTTALRWSLRLCTRLGDCVRRRDLHAADAAMGEGPFTISMKTYNSRFQIAGPSAFSGIREMFVRDVYLRNGWLNIAPNAVVVDSGANMGNFSALALGSGPGVRVVAVEPSRQMNARFVKSLGLNRGFLDRVQLIRAFVGRPSEKQEEIVATDRNYADAEWNTEDDLISRGALEHISFLKCDIEGSEFGLLTPDSKLLAMTNVLACEVHAFAGDVAKFVSDIEASGFTLGPVQDAPDGSVTLLAARHPRVH